MSQEVSARTYQDAVMSGLSVPVLRGAFAQCRRETSIVIGKSSWFLEKVVVLVPRHREVLLYLVDTFEDAAHLEDYDPSSTFSMKELLWVNCPSLNKRAVDAETGEPIGFDLIFRTATITLVKSGLFYKRDLVKSADTIQQILQNWKPSVKCADLFKINRFGSKQKRWFMLENNVDLSWYNDRYAVTSKNSINIDELLYVQSPSSNSKASQYPLSADLIIRNSKKDKLYHLAAEGDPRSLELLQRIISHWTLEDLRMARLSATADINKVCFLNFHLSTVNSKLATSVEDFGFHCMQFDPIRSAPSEWAGQQEPHVRIVDFEENSSAESAGMWMHDAIVSIDGTS